MNTPCKCRLTYWLCKEKSIIFPFFIDTHKPWGELSGYRKELAKRNAAIIMEYDNGISVEELAERYFLSVSAIRKIIYQR